MRNPVGSTEAPPRPDSDGYRKIAALEPDATHGLTHLLALSSETAEDRALLRAYGVSARHWVHKPRRTPKSG